MPEPEVIRVMRQFKASLLAGERTQLAQMATRWLGVERRLSAHMDALALQMTQIAADGGTVSAELLLNDVRYRTLLVQLTQELEGYTDYANVQITAQQRRLARLGIAHSGNAIEVQGIAAGFNRLPIEAVEFMVGLAGDGSPLMPLLTASWPLAADGMTQELINGVALGYNPRKTARLMARGATGSLQRMMVTARTETLRVYRHASLENYRTSGVVTGYKRLAAHDSRVCPNCIALEGTFYELDEIMPTHPSCRCTLVPIVAGVPNVTWLAGEEWFVEQSAARQESILGKGRYAAWRDGDFSLADVVRIVDNPIWGPTVRTVPLSELTA